MRPQQIVQIKPGALKLVLRSQVISLDVVGAEDVEVSRRGSLVAVTFCAEILEVQFTGPRDRHTGFDAGASVRSSPIRERLVIERLAASVVARLLSRPRDPVKGSQGEGAR